MVLVPGRPPHRVDAELVYDTRNGLGTPGLRAAIQRSRRLLYTADNTEVILQIAPDRLPANVRLTGQVLDDGSAVEGATISLHGQSEVVDRPTDDDGEFRISDLPKGSYGLDVRTDTRLIGVAAIDLD